MRQRKLDLENDEGGRAGRPKAGRAPRRNIGKRGEGDGRVVRTATTRTDREGDSNPGRRLGRTRVSGRGRLQTLWENHPEQRTRREGGDSKATRLANRRGRNGDQDNDWRGDEETRQNNGFSHTTRTSDGWYLEVQRRDPRSDSGLITTQGPRRIHLTRDLFNEHPFSSFFFFSASPALFIKTYNFTNTEPTIQAGPALAGEANDTSTPGTT